jgi:hypothetical protein
MLSLKIFTTMVSNHHLATRKEKKEVKINTREVYNKTKQYVTDKICNNTGPGPVFSRCKGDQKNKKNW